MFMSDDRLIIIDHQIEDSCERVEAASTTTQRFSSLRQNTCRYVHSPRVTPASSLLQTTIFAVIISRSALAHLAGTASSPQLSGINRFRHPMSSSAHVVKVKKVHSVVDKTPGVAFQFVPEEVIMLESHDARP